MSIAEILSWSGGGILLLLTLVQIAPIKVDPWSAIMRAIGRGLNGDVIEKLNTVEKRLDGHIKVDDERNADAHRAQILSFNLELMRGLKRTREDFIEILAVIDFYEDYCREHKDYRNNRCVLAIENIERVYRERMEENDFL